MAPRDLVPAERMSLQIGGVDPVLPEATTRTISERTFAFVEAYAR